MALSFQVIGDYFRNHVDELLIALLILIVGYIIIKIIGRVLRNYFLKVDYDPLVETFIQRSINALLWILLMIISLSNLGVNVTAFIAGLGIAGFIVGFATRDVFSNIAAGLFILAYRPFSLGDEVEVGGVKGILQEINLSACIVTTKESEWVLVPNGRIWGNPIRNLSRLKKKKVSR